MYSGMGYDVIYYGKLMYTSHKRTIGLGLVLHCRQQQYKSQRKYMDLCNDCTGAQLDLSFGTP